MNIGRELICDVKLLVTFNDFVNDKYEFSPCVCFVGELHLGCISVRVDKPMAALTSPFLGHLFEHDLIIWVSMSFNPSVRPSVRPLRKWRFSNSISSAISQAILNLIVAYESMGQFLNFDRAGFSIFAFVFVSRDFKVGKKCKNDDFHAKMTIFKIYLLLHFSSDLEFDCGIWIYGEHYQTFSRRNHLRV